MGRKASTANLVYVLALSVTSQDEYITSCPAPIVAPTGEKSGQGGCLQLAPELARGS